MVLGDVGAVAAASWESAIAAGDPIDDRVAAIARLCAFSDLFLAAPVRHRREFRLQQELLVTPGLEDVEDAGALVPLAMHVLGLPQRLLAEAARVGALQAGGPVPNPIGGTVDPSLARTLAWVVALNGALMADGLTTGLPTTGAALGDQITDALLVGWGAAPADLLAARARSRAWAERDPNPRETP